MKHALPLLLLLASSAFSQTGGALAPVAAPGLTMKSLDQVEPRIAIVDGAPGVSIDPTTGTVTIGQSGSYYLTESLTVSGGNGITINASGVTLNLSGYSISSTSATPAGSAIQINQDQAFITNGHIVSGVRYNGASSGDQYTGTGFGYGVLGQLVSNTRVTKLNVLGVDYKGIWLSSQSSSLVEECQVDVAGYSGIEANSIVRCHVDNTGSHGIQGAHVEGCTATTRGSNAIHATMIFRSVGESYNSTSGVGLRGTVISYSRATCRGGTAIVGDQVDHCYAYCSGISTGGSAISADIVSYSYGVTQGTNSYSRGISASIEVSHSYGASTGSGGGHGIDSPTVSYSKGRSSGANSIEATIGVACTGQFGPLNITHKYLMP